MNAIKWVLLISLVLAVWPVEARAGGGEGIGVLGDSYSDEYAFYPPDRSTARNWVEMLADLRGLNFGPFTTADRGEPRNQGFAYNWARSDATTEDMIRTGQHTGLAAQVARGEVRLVYIFIGGNDFINAFHAPDPDAALRAMLPRALDNYRVAVAAILGADPRVRVLLGTLPDIRNLPDIDAGLRSGKFPTDRARRFTEAMGTYNAQVRTLASGDPRVALLDLDLASRLANMFSTQVAFIAGQRFDRLHPSNNPRHFFLADSRHPGTAAQGHMARLFVDTINERFGAGIPPLNDPEILRYAESISGPLRDAGLVRAGGAPRVGGGLGVSPLAPAPTADR